MFELVIRVPVFIPDNLLSKPFWTLPSQHEEQIHFFLLSITFKIFYVYVELTNGKLNGFIGSGCVGEPFPWPPSPKAQVHFVQRLGRFAMPLGKWPAVARVGRWKVWLDCVETYTDQLTLVIFNFGLLLFLGDDTASLQLIGFFLYNGPIVLGGIFFWFYSMLSS